MVWVGIPREKGLDRKLTQPSQSRPWDEETLTLSLGENRILLQAKGAASEETERPGRSSFPRLLFFLICNADVFSQGRVGRCTYPCCW